MSMYHGQVPLAQSPSGRTRLPFPSLLSTLGRCVRSKLELMTGQAIRYSHTCIGWDMSVGRAVAGACLAHN
jgi:hypothetical protein